jgi:hypothetical protein
MALSVGTWFGACEIVALLGAGRRGEVDPIAGPIF